MTPVHSIFNPIPLALYNALPLSAKPQVCANSPPSPIPARTSFSEWLSRSTRDNHSCLLTQVRSPPSAYLNSSPRPENINF
jgi:hypothetical protein